jgi:hypothetical protein
MFKSLTALCIVVAMALITLIPYSQQTNYMSVYGYLRWQTFLQSGQWE